LFGWFWVSWCLNTVKEWQDNVKTCDLLGRVRLDYGVFGWFGMFLSEYREGIAKESRNMLDGLLGWVRLDYVVFGWFWVSWCRNTVKKKLRKKIETC